MEVRPNKSAAPAAEVRQRRSRAAAKLVAALAAGGPRRPVKIPLERGEVDLELRLITGRQQLVARKRAHEMLEHHGLADQAEGLLERCELVEAIAVALVVPGTDEQLYESGEEMQGELTEAAIAALVYEYRDLDASSDLREGSVMLREEVARLLQKKDWTTLRSIVPRLPSGLLATTVDQLLTSLGEKCASTE
jgi:hypothetical protein